MLAILINCPPCRYPEGQNGSQTQARLCYAFRETEEGVQALSQEGSFHTRRKRAGGSHHKKKEEKQKEPDLSQSPPDEAQLAANRASLKAKFIKQIQDECSRLKPKQGSALTKGEARAWCLIMNQELAKVLDKNLTAHLDDGFGDAARGVATRFADKHGFTHNRVNKVYEQYLNNLHSTDKKKDPVPDFRGEMAKKRKKASREFRCLPKILYKQDPENADEEPRPSYRPYELVMEKALEEFKGHVTLQYIKEMFSKDLNVNVSKKTVSKFLHQVLGYNYCRADARAEADTEHLARIRRFLIEYADALQKERANACNCRYG